MTLFWIYNGVVCFTFIMCLLNIFSKMFHYVVVFVNNFFLHNCFIFYYYLFKNSTALSIHSIDC